MLYKIYEEEKFSLIIAVYVDNVLISGKKFKERLGKLKRHLGIWYEWIKINEESIIKINMDDMARRVVKGYETMTNLTLKE